MFWGLGSNGWYVDPINGGRPGGDGLSYDVASYSITAFNKSGEGSAGGMAFSIDPGSFPQVRRHHHALTHCPAQPTSTMLG